MCSELDMRRVWLLKGERKGKGFLREKRLLEMRLPTQ